MESAAVNAARWVVGKALSPLSGGFVEAWAASTELGPNIGAIKTELLYAQGMLHNARGRETSNLALQQLLLQLRGLAYDAEDVLDELDYFRIQDELDGTYEAADEHGLLRNARHTARNVKKALLPAACSCAGGGQASRHADEEEAATRIGCTHKLGKRLPCLSFAPERDGGGYGSSTTPAPTKGCRFLCCSGPCRSSQTPKLKFDRVDLSRRMKHIVEQLKPVCAKVSTILNLELLESNRGIGQYIAMSLNAEFSKKPRQAPVLPSSTAMSRPVTTSEFIDPAFYGRVNESTKIITDITQGEYCDKDLIIVPIVGPGGIGKTTLTQHIYKQVQDRFDVKIWVCVSLNFDVHRLKEEIAKSIPKVSDEKPGGPDGLIEQRLKSKKFLLVLDDMWNCGNEGEWERLKALLRKAQTKGNIILVTTRFPTVAETVERIDRPIQLEGLETEEFRKLFQAYVFDDDKTINDHADLKETGEKIAKKLKGSPLAAKTVGRLLRNHLDLDHWTSVLESKEWELQSGENDIMPALKLSYDYLPFHLQQCFVYCALYPEDYRFDSDEMIYLWIGLDILQSDDQNKRIEDIGMSYLNDLVNYGFFKQDKKTDGSPCYVMHDLLHDLALKVSSYECLSLSSSNVRSIQILPSIRHLSIVMDDGDVNDRVTFEKIKKDFSTLHKRLEVDKLHSLMLFGQYHGSFVIPFGKLLSKAKSLRVILLSSAAYAVQSMLHNFSKFVHLRYLSIRGGYFPELSLPNIISRFYHLRIVDVKQCVGEFRLPRDMDNLVRLRHFLVLDDGLHSHIANVGKLKCLQELRRFEVKGQAEAFALRQIGQLEVLKGSLGIYNLENAQTGEEANLLNKRHLHKLVLVWSDDSSRTEHVLENLKPHDNLQELHIKGHGGTTCPSWLGVNLSTKNLQSLCLDGIQWNKFPPLGELWLVNACGEESLSCTTSQSFQKLKRLELVGIPRLAKWAGNDASHVFSLLEVFIVRDCPELMELPFSHSTCPRSGPEMNLTQFPTLRELEIVNCPKVSSFPRIPWTSSPCRVLIDKVGSDFQQLKYSKNDQSEFCLVVEGKDGHLDMSFWNVLAFSNLTELKELDLKKCPPLPLKHLLVLSCLRSLTIRNTSNVLSNVEAENTVGYQFPIEHLRIHNSRCSGKELTLLLSLFPKLLRFSLGNCGIIRGLGVAKEQTMAMSASSSSLYGHKLEDARLGEEQEQLRGEDEKAAADAGLLLLPHQLQELVISNISELILQFDSLVDGTAGGLRGIGGGLQGLHSLRTLSVWDCPNFLSSYYSSCFPFPSSLQDLGLYGVGGMETLAPLSNLSSLTRLIIEGCMDLSGEGLSSLLAHGQLTYLRILETPKFFVGCGSDPLRLQCLETDDITKVLATPICSLLASSLTKLNISCNEEVERFTKEQSAALLLLSSLQDLQFWFCRKLQSLPAGLHRLTSLKILMIWSCPAIRSLPKGGLPSSLEVLDVRYSGNEELRRQCRKLRGTIPIIKDKDY